MKHKPSKGANPKKPNESSDSDQNPIIIHSHRDQATDQILILQFTSPRHQHAALARIEAFYEAADTSLATSDNDDETRESNGETSSDVPKGRYLTLQQAAHARICNHYDGFNFPISAVLEWVRAIGAHLAQIAKITASDVGTAEKGWESQCNSWELALLHHLQEQGVPIDAAAAEGSAASDQGAHANRPQKAAAAGDAGRNDLHDPIPQFDSLAIASPSLEIEQGTSPTTGPKSEITSRVAPTYVISTLSGPAAASVLAHERQHALFHLCPWYAQVIRVHFSVESAPSPPALRLAKEKELDTAEIREILAETQGRPLHTPSILKAIQYDLQMRNYDAKVWHDEWQAYLSVPKPFLVEKEFGAKCKAEVEQNARVLRRWSQLGWEWVARRREVAESSA